MLAPVALLAGIWMLTSEHAPGRLRITIDRAQALARAREEAIRLGFVPASSGSIKIKGNRNEQAAEYFHPDNARQSVFPQPYDIRVAFRLQEEDGNFTALLAGDGSLLGFEADVSDSPAVPAAAARTLAEQELRGWLSRNPGWRAGEIREESGEDAAERRFSWRLEPSVAGEPAGRAEVLVKGRRLARFNATLNSQEDGVRAATVGAGILTGIAGCVIVVLAIYAVRLCVRRWREEEIPRERANLLVVLFTAFGLLSVLFNIDAAGEGDAPRDLTYWVAVLVAALTALFSFLGGLLLAAAYSGTDGEVREGYREKITSFDALLSGRWFTQPVGLSVVRGAAWACWAFLGCAILIQPVSPRFAVVLPETLVSLALGRAPSVALAARLGLHVIWIGIAGLFVPLAYAHRDVRTPARRIVVLLLVPFLLASAFQDKALAFWPLFAFGLCSAAALVLPFLTGDLLAAVSSFACFSLLVQTTSLLPLVSSWTSQATLLLGAAFLVFLLFAAAAMRGPRVDANAVVPSYVGNLERRLSLRAEVNAARQAQLRLLPQKPPTAPGAQMVAVCLPSSEVSGDFYDFTTVNSDEVAIFVASGGRSPVASALAIALAKGFLACDLGYAEGPDDSLARLQELLRRTLGDTSDHLDLTLALLRPTTGEIRIARTNQGPGAWVLTGAGGCRAASDSLRLAPGESLLLCTPGLLRLLDDQSASGLADWFRGLARSTAGAGATQVLDAVLNRAGGRKRKKLTAARLRADVTAVVVTREAA